MERYLTTQIKSDLKKKMVFVGGPRQVGKTYLAKQFLGKSNIGYLNWDDDEDRENILRRSLPTNPIWIFDEIHKYRRWRNFLKGLYDKKEPKQQILVTGSARLDLYRFGGDSLQGRYHFLRLFPLSVAELKISTSKDLIQLLRLSGFPEPFFSGSESEAKRWTREYRTRLVREDINQLENLQQLDLVETLALRLPDLVGSPLSLNSLREDLQVSHQSIQRWILVLEKLYSIFLVPPFGAPKIRAVKKEQKHYHFDWSLVKSDGSRFENFIAVHLLKWVSFEQDTLGRELELRYFRDRDGREVDFVITEDRTPILFVEVKWSDDEVSKSLRYLSLKFPGVRAVQVHAVGKKNFTTVEGIVVTNAVNFLAEFI